MKKRILSALLAGLMVFGCVGCGGNKTDGDVTTIKFWSSSGSTKSTLEKIVEDYNNGRGKEKGVKVELTVGDIGDALDIAHQNNELPDITGATYVQAELFAKQGDLIPIENFEGGKEFLEKMNSPVIEKRNAFDGKTYAVLNELQTSGLIYNKDLFKKAGLVDENGEAKPPKTWEELREYAKILTDKSNGIYGYSFPYDFSTYYTLTIPYATSLIPDGELKDFDELTVKPNMPYADLFNLMMAMRDDGSLFPGAESLDNDTSRAYFAEGKIGMMPAVSWDVGVLTTQFVAKCDWAVAPGPVQNPDKTYPAWCAFTGGYYLTKTAMEHPDKVFDFYQYLFSDEIQLKLCKETGCLLLNEELMAQVDDIDEHALQFRDLYDVNRDTRVFPSYTIEGENEGDMYQKVWAGKMTAEEAAKELAKNDQAGLRKAVESGTLDVSAFKKK